MTGSADSGVAGGVRRTGSVSNSTRVRLEFISFIWFTKALHWNGYETLLAILRSSVALGSRERNQCGYDILAISLLMKSYMSEVQHCGSAVQI